MDSSTRGVSKLHTSCTQTHVLMYSWTNVLMDSWTLGRMYSWTHSVSKLTDNDNGTGVSPTPNCHYPIVKYDMQKQCSVNVECCK